MTSGGSMQVEACGLGGFEKAFDHVDYSILLDKQQPYEFTAIYCGGLAHIYQIVFRPS